MITINEHTRPNVDKPEPNEHEILKMRSFRNSNPCLSGCICG
ncbi:hypothetical protein KsCSTR_31340 [Candidatus Kuenenia stuttgartiensis]|uniref:Uncharacterized protein n=1 Tax=Kuenenia stuttgartiensis TaxID=174633 RepID=A0A6G7GT64_KUEST|nr:hypothetical protein KsCSTR_31340 [Candidatus Kuenenia stuttgartiensis]